MDSKAQPRASLIHGNKSAVLSRLVIEKHVLPTPVDPATDEKGKSSNRVFHVEDESGTNVSAELETLRLPSFDEQCSKSA